MAVPRRHGVADRAHGSSGGGGGEGMLLHAAGAGSGCGLALHQVAVLVVDKTLCARSATAADAAADGGNFSGIEQCTAVRAVRLEGEPLVALSF